jgi:flavin reductase (DIM6/NTAB) family NADH-FMN oxidoreductase RutF
MKKSIGANTIVYPTPVLIVGTYDATGKPNVMAVAWGGICCSDPPCVAIALRKATYTYGNIVLQKAFTVSIPSEKHARAADYFGIASGKNVNKFDVSGLTPVKSALVNAPYIEEFPLVLECKLIHQVEIGLHTQFIGEILDIKAEEGVLDEKGMPDIEKVRPFFYDPGVYAYYRIGEFLGEAFSIGKDLKKKA